MKQIEILLVLYYLYIYMYIYNLYIIVFITDSSNLVRKVEWIKIMKFENKFLHKKNCLCFLHFNKKFIDVYLWLV